MCPISRSSGHSPKDVGQAGLNSFVLLRESRQLSRADALGAAARRTTARQAASDRRCARAGAAGPQKFGAAWRGCPRTLPELAGQLEALHYVVRVSFVLQLASKSAPLSRLLLHKPRLGPAGTASGWQYCG